MSDAPTLLQSHDVSTAPQLRSVCSPCHPILTNPHNTGSIRSLSALKIMDRLSCYAIGFSQAEATKEHLAALFGRFGEVTSIRLIQNRNPSEAYIRFSREAAALRAIAWCSTTEQPRMSGAHGYNKYCIKFINNKPCRKDHCPNQHQWVPPRDIIERTTPAQQPKKPKKVQRVVQNATANAQRVPSPSPSQWNTVADLQQRFGALQTLFSEQNSTVQCLLSRVKHLKQQNEALRIENGSLSQAQKPKLTYPMSPMSVAMSAKGAMSHGLSQNIIDNDMAELVDFVISDNAQLQLSNGYGHANINGSVNGYGYDAFVGNGIDNRIYHSNLTPPMSIQHSPHTQNINTQRWQ